MNPARQYFTLALFTALTAISQSSLAGYLGVTQSSNNSVNFHQQENGYQINFGSDVNSWLDLEWSLVDYGNSIYNDPTFVLGDPEDEDDVDRYTGILYGSQYVNDETAQFSGLTSLRNRGISAGLKFKKQVASWLDLYARVSLMAWEAESIPLNLYAPRDAYDEDGNALLDPDNTSEAANLNPCGTLDFCRIEDTGNPVHTWAVDFWYGYGATIKPFSWLALRAEYSVITLNAINFPKSKLESFTAGFEIYY